MACDGPEGPSQATRLFKHKNFVSRTKSFFADGLQTTDHMSNVIGVNMASAIEAVRQKIMQLQGGHRRGGFLKLIFHMMLYIFKFTCFRVTIKSIIVHHYIINEPV